MADPVFDYYINNPFVGGFWLQGNNSTASSSNVRVFGANVDMGQSLGQSVRMEKSAGLQIIPIPFTDSNMTLGFDIEGTKREFTFDGTLVGTPDQISQFISAVETIINGTQYLYTTTLTYRYGRKFNGSTLVSTPISIIISSFAYSYKAANEGRLDYTLVFTEARRDF